MSVISNISHHKKVALWKVSDQTKTNNKEFTVLHSTYQLPERFSPSKKGPNQSRLLNSSMEKLKLSKFQPKKERSPTPKNNQRHPIVHESHINLKSSTNMTEETPRKVQKFPIVNLNSKDSCFSLNSDKVRNISSQGIRNLVQEHQTNRKMILQLKEEFLMFKKSVLEQMNLQRKMVLQYISKIQQTCSTGDIKQINLTSQLNETRKSVQYKAEEQASNLLNFQSVIKSLQKNVKSYLSQVQQKTANPQDKIKSLIVSKQQYTNNKDEINQQQPKSEQIIKQSNFQQQTNSPQATKKSSPHLFKCNQIAQTINILNQINASPVSSPKNAKSTEKQMIEEYKQKILAVTKSNDNLIKQKTRLILLRTEQQNKVKGNFKLQKFYNAIQKLKEEVNEIKSINEPKNSKILK